MIHGGESFQVFVRPVKPVVVAQEPAEHVARVMRIEMDMFAPISATSGLLFSHHRIPI